MSLRLVDVSKSFGGIHALQKVNLVVGQSELIGLIGPNGSGKTTLINTITGFHRPDMGEINWRNRPIAGRKPNEIVALGLGRTFQITRAFRRMTVMENMLIPGFALMGHLGRTNLESRASEVLEFLTLEHLKGEYARALSGGQRKLLELGQVLMADPAFIFLDEPFAGVHPRLREKIMEYIQKLHRDGKGFLIVSHDMMSVFALAERMIVLNFGIVISDGPPDDVRGRKEVIDAYLGDDREEDG